MFGNVHAMAHRATAISVACLASIAFVMCFVAGMSCSFVQVTAKPERILMTPDEIALNGLTEAFFGVLCTSPFYSEDDHMWNRSRAFLIIGLILGGLTAMIAWTLSVCVPPTDGVWRAISVLGAGAAVFQVPIFLILESEPCNMDINRQTCQMASGAYLNMVSVLFFVILTLWTQLVSPPSWTEELNSWRRQPDDLEGREVKLGEISIPSGGDSREGTEEETVKDSPQSTPEKNEEPRPFPYWRRGAAERQPKEEEYPFPEITQEGPEDEDLYDNGRIQRILDMDEETTVQGSTSKHKSSSVVVDTNKPRSIWKAPSLFALASRPRKDTQPEERDPRDPEGASPVPESKVPINVPGAVSWGSQDVEYLAPAALVNRETSLLSMDDESDQSSVPLPPPPQPQVELQAISSDPNEHSGVGAFSLVGLKNRFLRSPVEDPPQRLLKFSIICPDGTVEKKRVGYEGEEEDQQQQQQDDDDKAPDDELAEDRTHVTESQDAAPSPMAPRDFVMTHSLGRPVNIVAAEQAEDRIRSGPARTENTPYDAATAAAPAPLELFSVTHSMSYDDSVSDMTPGPHEVREDTLAILQDLRLLEK